MLAFNDKFGLADKKFRVLYSNRNIRRKMPCEWYAFKYFVDGLPEEERDDCVLIFHCAPSDPNGTDLPRVCRHLMPDYNVAFTYTINNGQPFDDKLMNYCLTLLMFMSTWLVTKDLDWVVVTLTVGTPIIVNMTGDYKINVVSEMMKETY